MKSETVIENRTYRIEQLQIPTRPILHYLKFDETRRIETTFFNRVLAFNDDSNSGYSLLDPQKGNLNIDENGLILKSDTFNAAEAFAISGEPSLKIFYSEKKPFFSLSVIQDLHTILRQLGLNPEVPHALSLNVKNVFLEGYMRSTDGKRLFSDEHQVPGMFGFGFSFLKPEHLDRNNEGFARLSKLLLNFPFGASSYFMSLLLSENPNIARLPDPETMFSKVEIDVYLFKECVSGY